MEIKKFKGLRNTTSAERLPPGDFEAAYDVDLDDTLKVRSRQGFTSLNATNSHSLWAKDDVCLVMQGSDLKRMDASGALTALTRLQSARPVSYDGLNGVVYFSNGVDTGRVVGGAAKSWGVTPPTWQPAATPSIGNLPAGRYLYALTFLRVDGHESGTGLSGVVELASPGGILFSQLETSTNPDVTGRILYLSSPNGEVLYRAAVIDNSVQSYLYRNDGTDLTAPLETQFGGPPPAGTIVDIYNGMAVVVQGSVAYYSDTYALEMFRLRSNFLQFPGRITMFASLCAGAWVSTDENTWWLKGDRYDQMTARDIVDYGAIPGTVAKCDAAYFQGDTPGEEPAPATSGPAVVWATPKGICVGFDDGTMKNLTERRYSFPSGQRGAGLVRQTRGYTQYLAVLQGTGVAANANS